MRYLPHTPDDITKMLARIGLNSLDELLAPIPDDCRNHEGLKLPEPMSEWQLNDHLDELAQAMAVSSEYLVFMGAGSYDHYIPATVTSLINRSEFSTAYTPYQPEISQGTLQAIFEFQTLCCRLLGMDVATASHYDGATALAEAALMALKKTGRRKIAISKLCHPLHRQVLATYLRPGNFTIIELPYDQHGKTDLSALEELDDLAAIIIQSPNFFGTIEELGQAREQSTMAKALFIVSFTEPLAYGLLKNPGYFDADLAVGDGQSLGIPQSYGGPGLGIITAKKSLMRALPGRLVGQTVDSQGRRGFVLTLAAREQHIRREKASSNICSNNNLTAINAAIYMASLGGSGFRELSVLNQAKCQYLKATLKCAGVEIAFAGHNFNEFVIDLGPDGGKIYEMLLKKKIIAGLPLERFYPTLKNHYLLCATETRAKEDLDRLVMEVSKWKN